MPKAHSPFEATIWGSPLLSSFWPSSSSPPARRNLRGMPGQRPSMQGMSHLTAVSCRKIHFTGKSFFPDFTPEMEVFYKLIERCHTKNRKGSIKQHKNYFNFRSKIQLDHSVGPALRYTSNLPIPACKGCWRSTAKRILAAFFAVGNS